MKQLTGLAAFLLALLLTPGFALADAASDLADGRAALAEVDLDKALPLLTAAAQALPESVEAQLALGECHLRMGNLDEALAQYRAVAALSPNHTQATRMITALTGRTTSVEKQIAAAQTQIQIGGYDQAAAVLANTLRGPLDPAQRNEVDLLAAQAKLWGGSTGDSLAYSLTVIADGGEAGHARILAALALILQKDRNVEQAEAMLAQAGDLEGEWQSRADIAGALINLARKTGHDAASRTLAVSLKSIPPGHRENNIKNVASAELLRMVSVRQKQGDLDGVLSIVWPMISDAAEVPNADAVLQPVALNSGWLVSDDSSSDARKSIAKILASMSYVEFVRDGSRASLLGHWLAAELVENDAALTLQYATELASYSRVSSSRKAGEILSRADAIQREMLLAVAALPLDSNQQKQLVGLISVHLDRYAAAKDLETGLAQFATVADDGLVTLAGQLAKVPPGTSQKSLLAAVAQRCATLGSAAFQKASQSVVVVDAGGLGKYDLATLRLRARIVSVYPDGKGDPVAMGIFERLAVAAKWDDAATAINLYYSLQPEVDGRWALARLKIRRAVYDEDRLLAARRALGENLSEAIQATLTESIAILEDDSDANRAAGIDLLGSLVTRYLTLGRSDLSVAVIDTLSHPETGAPALAAWALWSRAVLLDAEANRTLAVAARASLDRSALEVDPQHDAALKILAQIITEHAESRYAVLAVEKAISLSNYYHSYRAWSAATKIPTDFMEAVPNLASVEQFQYRIVEVQLGQAGTAFLEQFNGNQTPEALIAEDVAAIDALADFLNTYPVGASARQAEDQLFAIARRYGQAGGWSATRDVLDRFAEAIPDFRSPAHLKLLRAATFLGELDRAQGLALLQPALEPAKPADGYETTATALAMNEENDDGKYDDKKREADPFGPVVTSGPAGKPVPPGESGESPKLPAQEPARDAPATGTPGFAGGGFGGGVDAIQRGYTNEPTATSLAMIRQSQQQQFQRLAMLEAERPARNDGKPAETPDGIVLPSGAIISEAEMARQDDAADAAYAILIELVKDAEPRNAGITTQARSQVMWLFGYFEGSLRADRAIALIQRYLNDHQTDPERVALAYRIVTDRLAHAASTRGGTIDLEWVVERHEQFEQARAEIAAFIAAYEDETDWVHVARLLVIDSFQQEAQLVAGVSRERASGLLVQSADALLALQRTSPEHPQAGTFANRLWNVAEQLAGQSQNEAAIRVLRHIAVHFPMSELAGQSIIRTAQLHAANLANPIRAVETYQEYLSKTDGDPSVPTEIFNIATQLAAQQRYLEALHVYGVFVDSFPTDARAATALHAIGQTHQANEAWEDAIDSYERVFEEYPANPIVPQTRLNVAECRINLGEWTAAKDLYADFAAKYAADGKVATAKARIDVLKKLAQFQDLLDDDMIERNKDDAQFQIGRTVLADLQNPIKAIAEFRKVVRDFGNSDLADDAQLEIGKALLSLHQMEEGRRELLLISVRYANSPLADDALYLVAQSYETQAVALAGVTLEKAREDSFAMEQKSAYTRFRRQTSVETERDAQERGQIKAGGDANLLALNEATQAWRRSSSQVDNLFGNVTQAELQAETETALQIANRQDRINDSYREAVQLYAKAAADYPLGDMTDRSLLRVAEILESRLKDRPAAMQTYQRIVKLFPGTPVAEDAAWKVAVFYVEESKYAQAVDGFQTFIRNYPASTRVADAQFAMAEVLEQMGRWNDAMDAYEVFRQKFAKHPKVQLASRQITWIKTYRK